MAEIKVLKIGAEGFPQEHASSDDLTMNQVTASTQLGVTSGVTITNNIAFSAVTDTVAGIQNQNLLDKTAAETISANWTIDTGYDLTLTDAPVNATDAANKAYVDSVAQGVDWQDSVQDKDLTTAPVSPSTGDRYIIAGIGGGWSGGTVNDIAEYDGASWIFITPNEGFSVWVEDEDVIYVYNGTAWVKMSSVTSHQDLSNLQGGTAGEYYHMTAAEDTWLAAVVADIASGNVADLSDNETVTGDWSFTGQVSFSGGDVILPTSQDASPAEGSVYWDGTSDTLYVYDGASWQDVSSAGTANSVQTIYTGGTGGIAQFDAVYISAADTVLKADASALSTAKMIGFAPNAISAAASGAIQENGVIAGILTGATPGDLYFLSETPGQIATTRPSTSGAAVVAVGVAKNATDLQIAIQFIGVRS